MLPLLPLLPLLLLSSALPALATSTNQTKPSAKKGLCIPPGEVGGTPDS